MSLTGDPTGDAAAVCAHCKHEIRPTGDFGFVRPIFDAEPEDQGFAPQIREALTRKVHVNCGSCNRGLKVSLRMAGRKTTCPACGKRVRLPHAGQEADKLIEELIARKTPVAAEPEPETQVVGMFDNSELADLATYVDTEGADESALEVPDDEDLMHRADDALEGREILALSAAVSAAAPPKVTGDKELPALQQAVRSHPRKTKKKMSGQKKLMLATIAAAVWISVGVWVLTRFIGGQPDPKDGDLAATLDLGENTPKNPDNGNGGENGTKPPKDPTTKTGPVVPVPVPVKAKAVCQALSSTTDSFAAGGFFPAKPGQVFCRVSMHVQAGDDKLLLNNYGETATLKIGSKTFASLGEPVNSILPSAPVRKRMSIPAKGSRTVNMLFELPQTALGTSATSGLVTLGTIAPAKIKLGSPAHVMPAKALSDGSKPYLEIAPRNTKPMLSDPVMSAIQNTLPQRLSIRQGKNDSIRLSLGDGTITGAARRDGRGLYITQLYHAGNKLKCLLRFDHGGKEAILYLSEEPFHQLTFAQAGWSKRVPVVPQGTSFRKPPRRPTKHTPTIKIKRNPKPRKTNGGPGFFGL